MKVPFLDLTASNLPLKSDLLAGISDVIDQSAFAGGPFVQRFEDAFASYCRVHYACGVGNGTDALWLVLLAYGIGPGSEVITAPNSFIATAEAISLSGATPVFVDVDPITYTLDPAQIEKAITPRTRAIIPVHLYGQTADMDPILEIARRYDLRVIEDACQAHGAAYHGRRAGSLGDAGCFSFYPGKNLGALGEAGAVVTNDSELAERIRVLRDHGQQAKYHHTTIGWNARMDGIQGAALSVKLQQLDRGNDSRRACARLYDKLLAGAERVRRPVEAEGRTHVYHLYPVAVPQRDTILRRLTERGISCGIHYPTPIHLQPAYRDLGLGQGSYPVAEESARQLLSLPMYPEMTTEQIEYVAHELCVAVEATFSRDQALVA